MLLNPYYIFRSKNISFTIFKKDIKLIFLFLVITLAFFLCYLSFGERIFSPLQLIKIFIGEGNKLENLLVFSFRMPRGIAAFLVGAGLSMSGLIIQSLIKNTLSSPSILGINDAALVGVLIFMTLFFDNLKFTLTLSIYYMPLFAIIGALVLLCLLYFLGFRQNLSPFKIILIGLGLGGIFEGLSFILIIYGPMIFKAQIHNWINGTVHSVILEELIILSIGLFFAIIVTIWQKTLFNISYLNDDNLKSLGVPVKWYKFFFLTIAVLIASICVAVAGSVSFIGLLAPHIAKRLVNSHFGVILPMSLLIGGSLGLLGDLMGRIVFYPLDLPMGIFISLIGVPFFIILLIQYKN